jgi:magnesium-transporting ATPase (P-type)
MLISLMCLITQSIGGSGPKRNLLLLGMQMLIINLVTHIICIFVPLCQSKLSSVV